MGGKILKKREEAQKKLAVYEQTLSRGKKLSKHRPVRSRHITGEDFYGQYQTILNPFMGFAIRPKDTWICRTYNDQRRLRSFIDHLFVRYPIPTFLYTIFEPKQTGWQNGQYIGPEHTSISNLRLWTIMMAQGRSFRKECKGVFTAQEAHLFLNAPTNNSPTANAWWAKATAAGWHQPLITVLLRKTGHTFAFSTEGQYNKKYENAIQFFARFQDELDPTMLNDLLDFISGQPFDFCYDGRTLGSMIRLSNEWHNLRGYENSPYHKQSWAAYPIKDWKKKVGDRWWEVIQLLSGKELLYEAKIQHHCVASYAPACAAGRSRIFTLHSTDKDGNVRKHTTIEIDPNSRCITQQRGKFNRMPAPYESQVIHEWAGENGVRTSRW